MTDKNDLTVERYRINISGIVQGVGFRPFVYNTANRLHLSGWVMNDPNGVVIEVQGDPNSIRHFLAVLSENAPPLAVIDEIKYKAATTKNEEDFSIVDTAYGVARHTLISPDIAVCDDCLLELFDPLNRRYKYPFINCINCGPRFSISTDIPYDRINTTMADFEMCDNCRREYSDPTNRRFHAQPISCPQCGPEIQLYDCKTEGYIDSTNIYSAVIDFIRHDKILALKGIGGYHLCVSALSESACNKLRERKRRYEKPLAIMVKDIEMAKKLCEISDDEEKALRMSSRPIVLLRKKDHPAVAIADSVTLANKYLGVMLPYTPIHYLIFSDLNIPLVMTSGNISEEPIAYKDDDAKKRLSSIADVFLLNNREISIRIDDSVLQVNRKSPYFIRRSRGFAPRPIRLPFSVPNDVLACGGELKNTFCFAKGDYAFISHHIGDLENYSTYKSFTDSIDYYAHIFDINPKVIAHDLHPEYLSTKYALEKTHEGDKISSLLSADNVISNGYMEKTIPMLANSGRIALQHHHSHIASCMLDNNFFAPVIGIAFDGSGYGMDKSLWGSEIMIADLQSFSRVGSLKPIELLGGAKAIKEPWRVGLYYLNELYGASAIENLDIDMLANTRWKELLELVPFGEFSVQTTSMGRLFDAVGALVCSVGTISYEAQAAIMLEQCSDIGERATYPIAGISNLPIEIDGAEIIRFVVEDILARVPMGRIASKFHNTIAKLVLTSCIYIRDNYDRRLQTVALSGGVFQNRHLLSKVLVYLESNSFRVLLHQAIPTNDAGISFGQIAIASQILINS